jgi:UDP-N-acetylglucosamine--N-acetylmuramyl-(pentapeptide) pyrophosphoryl-undecaprenol N-acetylglucosamine transferase
MRAERPVLITAGGTGGHVYPALAVARGLIELGVPVLWLGTRRGLEARVVPAAGIRIAWVSVSGLRGKGVLRWITAPFRLSLALMQALAVVLRHRPRAVLGMGGFVAGPGGLAAWLLRRPLVIHEQNAVPGLTNRLLSRLASRVLEGFPGTFPAARRAICTGNPVRAEISRLSEPMSRLQGRSGPLRLLVLGGSQGAQALNAILPETLNCMDPVERPEVWHQAGPRNIDSARRAYRRAELEARVEAYIEDMAEAYAWADVVLCRSGALTVAELAAAGVASLLVPFPHAVDDHQSANARFLAEAGAAVLLPQDGLTPTRLATQLAKLRQEPSRVLEMAVAARALACPEATADVVRCCLEVANGIDGAPLAGARDGGGV